jgi:hypothetical protein
MNRCSGRLRRRPDVEGQPLKGRLIPGEIAVSLKRYPDTKPELFRNRPATD